MLLFRRASLLSLAAIAVLFTSFASSEPQLDRPADRERREVKPADPNPAEECLQFNCDTIPSEINRDNVAQLTKAWQIKLIDIADTTPVFVSKVPTIGGIVDILVVSTMSGRVMAINAENGTIIWSVDGPVGPRWTTSSPAIDPNRKYVSAYGLDGYVHRYAIGDGSEVNRDGWPELITLKGDVEKCSSALSVVTTNSGDNYLYATIAAYPEPGDAGDYQGHLVAINLANGEQHVFNALCSDRDQHFSYDAGHDCSARQAGVWARAGAIYDPITDRTFVTTGNGAFDADKGGFNWGTSIVALHPDGTTDHGTPIDSYTPVDYDDLNRKDWTLSSTTVVILPTDAGRFAVQGGKDGRIRLIDLTNLSGQGGPRHLGGEMQIVTLSTSGPVFARPATWRAADGTAWLFVTTNHGVNAYSLDTTGETPQLALRWTSSVGGSTPIVDGGVLFYAHSKTIRALDPESGELLWSDNSIGNIHWQSPIVVNNALYVADHENGLTAYVIR